MNSFMTDFKNKHQELNDARVFIEMKEKEKQTSMQKANKEFIENFEFEMIVDKKMFISNPQSKIYKPIFDICQKHDSDYFCTSTTGKLNVDDFPYVSFVSNNEALNFLEKTKEIDFLRNNFTHQFNEFFSEGEYFIHFIRASLGYYAFKNYLMTNISESVFIKI